MNQLIRKTHLKIIKHPVSILFLILISLSAALTLFSFFAHHNLDFTILFCSLLISVVLWPRLFSALLFVVAPSLHDANNEKTRELLPPEIFIPHSMSTFIESLSTKKFICTQSLLFIFDKRHFDIIQRKDIAWIYIATKQINFTQNAENVVIIYDISRQRHKLRAESISEAKTIASTLFALHPDALSGYTKANQQLFDTLSHLV
ncbi:hypothetical protein AAEU42_00900 [Pseudoflavonifractor phocaeensis]|mgnify:CR=1 FL=1|uniref:hypothetical protein n=1 Tax=Pseudoflavonifractor phocaeensis TaxID=1870988 RepID=UPI00313B62C6